MPRISPLQPLSQHNASDAAAAATSASCVSSSSSRSNGMTASVSPSTSLSASSFASTARHQLSSAVLSQYSESSSSPLIRGVEEARKALARDVAADDWSDSKAEHEESVSRSLLSLRSLLSQAVVSPSSASSIARCFPELDSLLMAALQRLSSPAVLSALLDCCSLLLRPSITSSKAETAQQQQLRPWPRWLTTPTTTRDAADTALSRLLASSLPLSSPLSVPSSSSGPSAMSPSLRVSCAAFMSALSGCSSFDSSAASLWLLSLLPSLLSAYLQEAQTLAKRVTELRERGAARLLVAIFAVTDDAAAAGGGSSERDAEDDAVALSDSARFRLLCHLVSTIAAIIRSQRHDKPQQRCQPCSSAAFPSLLQAAAQLWTTLLSAAELFPSPSVAVAFPSSPLQTVLSFLSSSLSPLLHCFSHCSFVTAFAASACGAVIGPTAAPCTSAACTASTVVDWAELASNVALYLRHHRSQSTVTAASSHFHCHSILTIVEATKKTAAACRALSASACAAPPRPSSQTVPQPLSALLSLLDALLLSASSLLLPSVAARQDEEVELCHKQLLSLVLQMLVLYRSWAALLPALLSLCCSAFLPLASSLLQLPEMPLDSLYAVFGCLSRLLEAAEDEQQRAAVLTAAVACGVVDRSWWAMELVAAKGVSQDQQLVLKAGRQWMAALLSRLSWLRSCPAIADCRQWEERLSASYGQRAQTWHQRMSSLHQLRTASGGGKEEATTTVSADGGGDDETGEPQTSLSLFVLFLVCRGVRRRAVKESQLLLPLLAPQAAERWEGVQMDGRGIAISLQQLLLSSHQQQEQTRSSSSSASLPLSVLLHVALAASLMEEEVGVFLSSRAKAALFSLLVSAAVRVDDLALCLPIDCHLMADSLSRWCWRQTAPQLHERLLSSVLSRCSTATDDGLGDGETLLEKTLAVLVGEEGSVLAMVSRLADALLSWQQAGDADEHQQQQEEAERVEQLLLLCHRLCGCGRGEQLVAAGLLQPLTSLLTSRFHFAGNGSCSSRCICLLGLLRSIVALPPSVLVLIDSGFWFAAMDAAARCLVSHGRGSPADDAGDDSGAAGSRELRQAQLLCLQVMSAVVRCEQAEGVDAESLAEVCMSDIAVVDTIAALSRHGHTAAMSDAAFPQSAARRPRRIQLSGGDGDESATMAAGQFRLQLQVATLQLSALLLQAVVRAGGERDGGPAVPLGWYRALLAMDESAVQALSHRCLEARTAGLCFLIAFFSLDAVVVSAGDGDDQHEQQRLQVGYSALRPLLLAVQSFLLPHCSIALTKTALELLAVLLSSSPPVVKRRLRAQPWHSFLVQSRLFSLRAETATAASPRSCPLLSLSQQSNRLGTLLWHLDLLVDDGADSGADCCRDGEMMAEQDDDGDHCVVRRHLHSVDAELLLPLLFFPALADRPSSSSRPPVLCVSSLHRFLRLLPHIHHAQRLQLKARAQLPLHLHAVISFLRLTMQQPPPPAAALRVLLCPASTDRAPPDSAATLSSPQSGDGVACKDSSASLSSSPSSQPPSQPLAIASSPSTCAANAVQRAGCRHRGEEEEEDGGRVLCLCPAPPRCLVADVRWLLSCCERRAVAMLRLLSAADNK